MKPEPRSLKPRQLEAAPARVGADQDGRGGAACRLYYGWARTLPASPASRGRARANPALGRCRIQYNLGPHRPRSLTAAGDRPVRLRRHHMRRGTVLGALLMIGVLSLAVSANQQTAAPAAKVVQV